MDADYHRLRNWIGMVLATIFKQIYKNEELTIRKLSQAVAFSQLNRLFFHEFVDKPTQTKQAGIPLLLLILI